MMDTTKNDDQDRNITNPISTGGTWAVNNRV